MQLSRSRFLGASVATAATAFMLGLPVARARQGFAIPSHAAMAKIHANPRNLTEKISGLVPGTMLLLEGGVYNLTEPLRIANRHASAVSPMVIRPRGWGQSANALTRSSDRVTFKGRAVELLNCTYLARPLPSRPAGYTTARR